MRSGNVRKQTQESKMLPKNKLLFALLVSGIVSLVSTGTAAVYAADKGVCMSECSHCADVCTKQLATFEKKGGKYADEKKLNLLRDCIKMCQLNADFKQRGSTFAAATDKLCADVCTSCAKMCKELNDPSLKECIASCESCASCCSSCGGGTGK